MPSEPDPFTMSLVLMATFSSLTVDVEGEQQQMPSQTDCATVPTSVRAPAQLVACASRQPDAVEKAEHSSKAQQPDAVEKAEHSSKAQAPRPEAHTDVQQPLRKAARPQQLSDLKLAKELQQRCAKEHRRQAAHERRAEREAAAVAEVVQEVATKVASPDVELQLAFPQEAVLPAVPEAGEAEQQGAHQELMQPTVFQEAAEAEQQQHQAVLQEAVEIEEQAMLHEVDGSWEVVPEASFHDVLLDRVDLQVAEEDWHMVLPQRQSGV